MKKKIAKSQSKCLGLEQGMIFLNKSIEKYLFACRNFSVGNRVKVVYEGKLIKGIIQEKKINFLGGKPVLYIKTNEKVGEDNDLYEGYGLKGPVYAREALFFEWEELPEGDEIYRTIVERTLTEKELEKERQYSDHIPF